MDNNEIKLVPSKIEFLDTKSDWDRGLERITKCTRVAYRSNNIGKTDEEKRERDINLIKTLIFRTDENKDSPRHTSTLEHAVWGVVIYCSRAIANEFVRHRHTAYTQESTRYVNFDKKPAEFIIPSNIDEINLEILKQSYQESYNAYKNLLQKNTLPQIARDALPLGLATKMAMTTNIAEWRRIFELRCDKGAHPDARSIAWTILTVFNKNAPWAFLDLYDKFKSDNIPLCQTVE